MPTAKRSKNDNKFVGLVVDQPLGKNEKLDAAWKIHDITADLKKQKISRRAALGTIGKVGIGAIAVVVIGGVAYYVTTQTGQNSSTTSSSSTSSFSSTTPITSSTTPSTSSTISSTTSSTTSSTSSSAIRYSTFTGIGGNTIDTIDPADGPLQTELPLKVAVYETLIRSTPGKSGVFTPLLASSWSSTDGKAWTVKVQPNVKFHDGTTLDASAVAYNYQRLMTLNQLPSSYVNALGIGQGKNYDTNSIQVIDNSTVQMNFPQPISLVSFEGVFAYQDPFFLASPTFIKANEKVAGDWAVDYMRTHESGTGPYMLTQFVQDQFWVAERFPDYWQGWDNPQPQHLGKIVWNFALEVNTQKLNLINKQADFAESFNWPSELADAAKAVPGINQFWAPSLDIGMLRLDERGGRPLANKNLRKMLSYAFDYQGAIQSIYAGHVIQAKGPLPQGDFGWTNDQFQYTHDTTMATKFLNAAGYKAGELTLEAVYNEEFDWKGRLLDILQSNLNDIGVTLKITKTTSPTFIGGILNNPNGIGDIYPFIWPDSTFDAVHTVLFVNYLQDAPAGFNVGYKNDQFTSLMNKALVELDATKLAAEIKQLNSILIDDAAAVYCWSFQIPYAYWDWVKGYTPQLNIDDAENWWEMWIDATQRNSGT